jgi:hypothetical protein
MSIWRAICLTILSLGGIMAVLWVIYEVTG